MYIILLYAIIDEIDKLIDTYSDDSQLRNNVGLQLLGKANLCSQFINDIFKYN